MTARVLIVDDEPNIVTALRFLMEHAGYEVAAVGDGQAALAAVDAFAPDLVVLDVMLPQLDGFAVCHRLRDRSDGPVPKVVMLTAKGRPVEAAKGREIGADAYVTKPFSTRQLVQQVGELLEDRP